MDRGSDEAHVVVDEDGKTGLLGMLGQVSAARRHCRSFKRDCDPLCSLPPRLAFLLPAAKTAMKFAPTTLPSFGPSFCALWRPDLSLPALNLVFLVQAGASRYKGVRFAGLRCMRWNRWLGGERITGILRMRISEYTVRSKERGSLCHCDNMKEAEEHGVGVWRGSCRELKQQGGWRLRKKGRKSKKGKEDS